MKLNVIVAGRNDNYGDGFIPRLTTTLQSLDALRARHNIDVEFIFVEWSPVEGQPRLKDCVEWPASLPTRVITVPYEIHCQTPNSDAMGFLTHVALNAGIRRATADNILIIGAEIILSDEMGHFLGTQPVEENKFYRATRTDLKCRLQFDGSLENLYAQCRQNIRVKHNPADAAGDFILMSRERWHQLHGFQELRSRGTIDTFMVHLALSRGMQEVNLPWAIYHQDHNRDLAMGSPQIGWRDDLVGKANGDGWGLGGIELESEVVR